MVTVKDLRKSYGNFEAVKGVSFEINKGDFFGFLGPNGAGKTTVMGIISCFIKSSSGSVNVMGMDVNKYPSDIKANLGVVAQKNNLDPDISVFDNLIVYANYYGIRKKEAIPKAYELLEFVDLIDKKDSRIQSLSGGMVRRLQIARALVNSPKILIMDEPTTGLDPHARYSLWDRLEALRAETGMTMLLTTHYIEEAESLCNRVAIMDLGKIVTIDSPASLTELYSGSLEDVYLKLTSRHLES